MKVAIAERFRGADAQNLYGEADDPEACLTTAREILIVSARKIPQARKSAWRTPLASVSGAQSAKAVGDFIRKSR